MAKFSMSMRVLGLSAELKSVGVAVNALWPRTTIATAAVGNLLGGDAMMRASRTPEIMGDAAYVILTKPSREFTGQFCMMTCCSMPAVCAILTAIALMPWPRWHRTSSYPMMTCRHPASQ